MTRQTDRQVRGRVAQHASVQRAQSQIVREVADTSVPAEGTIEATPFIYTSSSWRRRDDGKSTS